MTKIFHINGVDFTDFFTPTGYVVSYTKRRGSNSGTMLDGTYVDDVLATKAIVTCTCMPTDETQLQRFLAAISSTYVSIRYFDPRTKEYRTMTAMPSEPSQQFRGEGATGIDYWTGAAVTFTEK